MRDRILPDRDGPGTSDQGAETTLPLWPAEARRLASASAAFRSGSGPTRTRCSGFAPSIFVTTTANFFLRNSVARRLALAGFENTPIGTK